MSDRDPNAQTEAGIELIIEPIEVEALPTAVLVLVLIPDEIELVFALIFAARDVEAVRTAVLVFVLICEVTEVDAD
ncbi:MAG: hypothetical protein NTV02_02645 [Candidatus Zambryskibacteria bacterium]|nr:hypothetical protein [Candidatus Zambryskibacteria bacterium]